MPPKVVFDLITQGYSTWIFPAAGLTLVIVSAILLRLHISSAWWKNIISDNFCEYLSKINAFGAIILIVLLTVTFGEYSYLKDAYKTGKYNAVEGCLTSFDPAMTGGHGDEVLGIHGQRFSYSGSDMTVAFHRPNVDGGPVTPDAWVRIFAVGPRIVHLEVAPHLCPAATVSNVTNSSESSLPAPSL